MAKGIYLWYTIIILDENSYDMWNIQQIMLNSKLILDNRDSKWDFEQKKKE